MLSVQTISSYFINRSSELNENDLTNLKLQKLLFYAQAENINESGSKVFTEEIEAWSYGPVVPSIYQWLKGCGAYPITSFDVETDASGLSSVETSFLCDVWEEYSKYSAIFLVKKTHEDGSPWSLAFKNGKSTVITAGSIKSASLANEW